ncbi:hypothetical protein BH24DEI2_BH24DEI2_25560 [soil metagenome]
MTRPVRVKLGAYVDELTDAVLVGIKEVEAEQGKEVAAPLKTQLVSLKRAYDLAVDTEAFETLPSLTTGLSRLLRAVRDTVQRTSVLSVTGASLRNLRQKRPVHMPDAAKGDKHGRP